MRTPWIALALIVTLAGFGRGLAGQSPDVAAVVRKMTTVVKAVVSGDDVAIGAARVSRTGGGFRAVAPATVFGREIEVRAALTSGGELTRLTADLPDVPIGLEGLRAGSAFMRRLPASLPMASGLTLHRLDVVRDAKADRLVRATMGVRPTRRTWALLGPRGVSADISEIELIADRPGDKNKRHYRARVLGRIKPGATAFDVVAEVKDDREYTVVSSLPSIDLAALVDAFAGDAVRRVFRQVPNAIRTLGVNDAEVRYVSKSGRLTFAGKTRFGRIECGGKGESSLLALAPSGGFKFADLSKALRSLDAASLDFSKLKIVVAGAAGKIDVPSFGLRQRRVERGTNLFATLDLTKLRLDRLLSLRTLDVASAIPQGDPSGLVLRAAIPTKISLGGKSSMRDVAFTLRPSPKRFKLALEGRMDLPVDRRTTLELLGEMAVEPLTQTVAGTFALDPRQGEWTEPFGLRRVGVGKLAASLGATFGTGIPLPTVGLQAGVRFGTGAQAFRGNGVVVLNPRDPMNSMIAADLPYFSLRQMLGLAAPRVEQRIAGTSFARALDAVKLRDVKVRLVPRTIEFAGSRFEKGLMVAGTFDVLGTRAHGLFEIDPKNGITALATMDRLRLANGRIVISGARGRRNPILALDLRRDRQSLLVDGKIAILRDFFVAETNLRVSAAAQRFYARGKLFGRIQAELEAIASGSPRKRNADYLLRARVEQTFLRDLRKRVLSEIDRATRKHVAKIKNAQRNVGREQKKVNDWDVAIAATRKRVKARQARDIANMRRSANRARASAERDWKRMGKKISSYKRAIKKNPLKAATLGPKIAALETSRRAKKLLMKTIGSNLVKGLAKLGERFPKELSSELGPMIASQKTALAALHAAQGVLRGYEGVVKGTSGAAKWIAKNSLGGAFDVNVIQLETRVSQVRGSSLAVQLRGQFLGKNFVKAMRLDLRNPAAMAKHIAKQLIDGKARNARLKSLKMRRDRRVRLAPPKALPRASAASLITAGA